MEKFLTSSDAPGDPENFLKYLQEKKVEYLVFVANRISTPVKLFPNGEDGESIGAFEPVMNSHTEFMYTNIWLYRVRTVSEADRKGGLRRPRCFPELQNGKGNECFSRSCMRMQDSCEWKFGYTELAFAEMH